MLTGSDQQFLIQLVGYAMGTATACVIVLYVLFKGGHALLDLTASGTGLIWSLIKKKKTV